MAFLNFNGVGIRGLAAAVPKTVVNNYEYTEHFPKEDVKKIVDKGYERAKKVLSDKIDDLHKLAKALLIYSMLMSLGVFLNYV